MQNILYFFIVTNNSLWQLCAVRKAARICASLQCHIMAPFVHRYTIHSELRSHKMFVAIATYVNGEKYRRILVFYAINFICNLIATNEHLGRSHKAKLGKTRGNNRTNR
jgi:hypothetical protein